MMLIPCIIMVPRKTYLYEVSITFSLRLCFLLDFINHVLDDFLFYIIYFEMDH